MVTIGWPKETRKPVNNVGSNAAVGSQASSGVLVPILSGAVLALVAGSLYFYYQLVQMCHDLDQLRNESIGHATNWRRHEANS